MGAKTKIDWCDSTWNPVTGCLHGCEYCYARRITERFGGGYRHSSKPADRSWRWWRQRPGNAYDESDLIGDHTYHANGQTHVLEDICYSYPCIPSISPPEADPSRKKAPYPYYFDPTFHRYKLEEPQHWKKPRTIFVCSMADLFGEWVPDEWIDEVILSTQKARQHRYLFLTKNPERYNEWLERFEESKIQGLEEIQNCWFGASASNNKQLERANRTRAMWLSIEPIRERIETDEDQFVEFVPTPSGEYERPRWAWVVIGTETGNSKDKVKPEKEWIDDIVKECDFYGTPVFMKESLRSLMGDDFRQEFPWEVK